jgi:hypothetical protein
VGIHSVWRAFNPVEGEMDAFCFTNRNQLGVKLQRTLPTAESSGAILVSTDSFLGHKRIELERMPANSKLVLAFNGGDGFFKPPFPDEAPGADHIGDHVNGEDHSP